MPDDHPGRFRWWMVPALLGGIAVVGIGVVTVLFLTREDPDPKPVEEVIEEFRSTTSTGPSTTASVATPDEPSELMPPAGVYVLEGAGREEISFPPVGQDDGATMPATVTDGDDGCWTFTVFYNEAHWQDWSLCPEGDRLLETGGHTFQRWDFGVTTVENLSTFVCDPPAPFAIRGAVAGSTWDRSCDGTNDQVEGTTTTLGTLTFVGLETLRIGGDDLEAMHFRTQNEITGSQTGASTIDLWLSVFDGMPLQGERDHHVESDSPIGSVSYTEAGHWRLTSMVPEA